MCQCERREKEMIMLSEIVEIMAAHELVGARLPKQWTVLKSAATKVPWLEGLSNCCPAWVFKGAQIRARSEEFQTRKAEPQQLVLSVSLWFLVGHFLPLRIVIVTPVYFTTLLEEILLWLWPNVKRFFNTNSPPNWTLHIEIKVVYQMLNTTKFYNDLSCGYVKLNVQMNQSK